MHVHKDSTIIECDFQKKEGKKRLCTAILGDSTQIAKPMLMAYACNLKVYLILIEYFKLLH